MAVAEPDRPGRGTLLRHVLELLGGDVARFEAELGLTDYRPRYTPVVRALVARGPMSIRDVARAISVTHSAASQTVNQMLRVGLLSVATGADARQRVVDLTAKARSLAPVLEYEWAATEAAANELDAELPAPLRDVLTAVVDAVGRRSMRDRIADAARGLPDPPAGLTLPQGQVGQ
jgi:DNA-binding MarR family transcriptional regulator